MTQFCLGQCGYDLYAEIHQNYVNQLIHGLFMPFVVYGTLLGVPALLGFSGNKALEMAGYIYTSYLMYYLTFDPLGMFLSALMYTPCLYFVNKESYTPQDRWRIFSRGVGWLLAAVGIQEIIGHTLFEEVNSDLWQLPNSILIAPIFGARCLFHVV